VWYSPIFFGVGEVKITWISSLIRFASFLILTVTISVLLNSLLISSVTGLLYFALWISCGISLMTTASSLARTNPEGLWYRVLTELGHTVFTTVIISSILFLI
jgi:hypothetical protein